MRFHNALQDVLSSPAKLAVLLYFLQNPDAKKTGREVAERTGLSVMGAWRALQDLAWSGLTSWKLVGKAHVWEMNRKHFLVKELANLSTVDARAKEEFKRILLSHLPLEKVETVYLFGSRARGDEKRHSDIDVCIVVKRQKDQPMVSKKSTDAFWEAHRVFADTISPVVVSKKTFDTSDATLYQEIRETGQILHKSDTPKG